MAKALLQFRTDGARLGSLSGNLAAGIAALRPDDRSFTATLAEAGTAVHNLGSALRGLGLSIHPLLDAWAGYLKRGLTAPRCQESVAGDGLKSAKVSVETFNAIEAPGEAPLTKIDFEEMRPKVILAERAEVRRYWASPGSEKIINDYSVLRFESPDQQAAYASTERADNLKPFLPLEERRTPDWIARARRFLGELEEWKEGVGETGVMHFAMITEMYSALLDVVPSDDPLFRMVLDSYIQLLPESALKRDNPAVWLLRTGELIDKGFAGAEASDLALIRTAIRQRGDSTMGALIDVKELLGR